MTPQEIFDKVLTHLRTQGVASKTISNDPMKHGTCAYRGANGTMCAVGCLIPNDLYTPRIENTSIRPLESPGRYDSLAVSVLRNLFDLLELKPHLSLLIDLQRAHDDFLTVSMDRFGERMAVVAKDYALKYDEVTA